MTALRDDALAVLRRWPAPDPRQERLRRRYVDHLVARPDGTQRDCRPAHLTAGVLLLSAEHERVLLTLHAKARRWFHLGGHCEPGDTTLLGAAAREAREESGLERLVLDPEPLHLDAHVVAFCGSHEQVSHLDVRYLAVAQAGATPTVSHESLDVRWWSVARLPTEDPDMLEMVAAARDRLDHRPEVQRSSAAT